MWALHIGQAGRSNGADGTTDDWRRDWVMVLPLKTGGSTTLSVTLLPGVRTGDGASMRRKELNRESILALGADRMKGSGWRRMPVG
jgi:hypothetical protein